MSERILDMSVRNRIKTPTIGESMTRQEFKKESDINTIVTGLRRGAQLPLPSGTVNYGDFTNVKDYHQSMSKLREAQEGFDRLPSDIREHFRNDPGKLIAAFEDADQVGDLIDMGLLDFTPDPKPESKGEGEPPPVVPEGGEPA